MLYVGIDIAKNKHDVTALNVPGKTVLKPLTFSNNKAGFELLDLSLRQLNQDCLIALKLLSDPNREQFQHDNRQVELKILARHIHRLKKKQSDWKVQYTRCLDIIFPELDKIVGKHSEYTYQLLTRYPNPQKRIEAGFDKLIEIKRLTASKIQDILSVAPRSIETTSPAREFEIIEIIKHYKRLIDKAETCVNDLMAEFNSVITTVTGIGGRLGAVILAEIRNIHAFDNPAQLQAFAGLDSSIYQSGQIDLAGRMIKRGSPHLRWALIQAAKACARFSPAFKAYLKTKLEQGKHYNVAIIHLAKKLIRTLFYILKKSCHLTNKK
ncbi:transposase [Streptococcus pneumoniae]|uniref:transposase n=3 Tax=Streptococcus pneumoniae TaxID=1313 RepID=UPI0007654DE3|nr:transposase [Streptococcus pneumoniae]CVQ04421.1 transposase [Streptococcus pneumoniae]CWA97876.1 transposase [Streptococcus pneumoniae]VIU68893.1 transposase [Streptococcus pneumoniae]VKP71986.1 transposase [Streptococcus pneumoniae]VLK33378.1 transposase [Streptococcus pneumoniae]